MSQVTRIAENLGRRDSGTLAPATTYCLFSEDEARVARRQAVSLNNCDGSAEIYVRLTAAGASEPTVSAADNDVVVPPKGSRQFQIGNSIDLWIRHSGSGSIAYAALELR